MFVDQFVVHVEQNPDETACTFLSGRRLVAENYSYAFLHRSAVSVAKTLVEWNLEQKFVGLWFENDIYFVIGILACFYSRAIAIPIPNTSFSHAKNRAKSILDHADPTIVLFQENGDNGSAPSDGNGRFVNLAWLLSRSEGGSGFRPLCPLPDDIAILQYTSGSIAEPKGVVITHRNLSVNQTMIKVAFNHRIDRCVVVNWLPFYHDMGLIGGLLHPLYIGARTIHMKPKDFLKRPLNWLVVISKYRAHTSGAPNFAFQLCLEAFKRHARRHLEIDLSAWKVAFCGSEPISASVLREFVHVFSQFGFAEKAFFPCYGMAEATLIITAVAYQSGFKTYTRLNRQTGKKDVYVSCGKVLGDQEIRIVDEEGGLCGEGSEGEVYLSGSNLFSGYYVEGRLCRELPEVHRKFFATGDIGFFHHSELYITGRKKHTIIFNGINYYPNDITWFVGTLKPCLDRLNGAVFTLPNDDLVILHELKRGTEKQDDELLLCRMGIKAQVNQAFGLNVKQVELVKNGSLPKTSSGKIQLELCKQRYLKNGFSDGRFDGRENTGKP